MKRRIAPKLLLVLGGGAAFTNNGVADATLLDEYGLHVRPDMHDELTYLSNGEFAPPPALPESPIDDEQQQGHDTTNLRRGHHHRHRATTSTRTCSSPLTKWTTDQIRTMGYSTYKTLYDNKIIQMPYVYKHYVNHHEQSTEYFVNDSQTSELLRRHRDTIDFWTNADIDNSIITQDILLLSMHGSDLKDNAKLVPTIMRIFDFTNMSDILAFATKVQRIVQDLPGGYDNPLLTMNAVATRSTLNHGSYNGHDDPSRRIKDSIIIGDGVLQFVYDSGLATSGPDFVHAHEFGHHLQFQMDLAVPPQYQYKHDDRRKELMADALGGYFLAHDHGGDMMVDEIGVFDETAFSTGDCSVTRDDHHGTPEQRRCAAVWGASLANERGSTTTALDPEVFVGSFNAAYEGILDLDWRECTLILEETTSAVTSSSVDYRVNEAWREEDEWATVGGGYAEEDEEEAPVSIGDWLNAAEEQNQQPQNQGGGGPSSGSNRQPYQVEWMDPVETEDKDYNRPPPSSSSGTSHGRPNDEEVIVSLFPVIDEEEVESSPWGETPHDEYAWLKDRNKNNGKKQLSSSSSGKGLVDRGTPPPPSLEESTPQQPPPPHMKNALTVRDCHMPWVYCYSSSAVRSVVAQDYFFSGAVYIFTASLWLLC
ncbi:hypothetical protein ACHAXR_006667 [Thalassiosira sp. AJA248-18]